jgi:hypothetical protein
VTVYPGGVIEPHGPYFGEIAFSIAMILPNRLPFTLRGGFPLTDHRAHRAGQRPGMDGL